MLGRNKKAVILVAVALVVIAVALVVWKMVTGSSVVTLDAGSSTYRLSVANSAAAQQKGLGGRRSLPLNQGMLFSFSGSAQRCFWMKDMEFPLDIIWVSANKQVVYIQPDALPSSYPETFCPVEPAKYVIELNSGQAKLNHIHVGQALGF